MFDKTETLVQDQTLEKSLTQTPEKEQINLPDRASTFLGKERSYPSSEEIKAEILKEGGVEVATGWKAEKSQIDFGGGTPQLPIGEADTSVITIQNGEVFKDNELVTGEEADSLLKKAHDQIEIIKIQELMLTDINNTEPLY